jgi:predicted N-formylglutamate amidohydrolase
MIETNAALLDPDEPPATTVRRPEGASPFVLACDHAGNLLPRRLGTLGLEPVHLGRHIAWDIGAAGVARRLSDRLDAALVGQSYSRLVIDCNRRPDVSDSIPTICEDTEIPGNHDLAPAEREARVNAIFNPYHERLTRLLDARRAAGKPSVLVAVHSFTPVFKGVPRPWHVGILYNRDPRLASLLLDLLRADEPDLRVGDNEPYFVSDENDYTIPVHGEGRGIPHVEIEVRQDLIAGDGGQTWWAERLAGWLTRGLRRLDPAALRPAAG